MYRFSDIQRVICNIFFPLVDQSNKIYYTLIRMVEKKKICK